MMHEKIVFKYILFFYCNILISYAQDSQAGIPAKYLTKKYLY